MTITKVFYTLDPVPCEWEYEDFGCSTTCGGGERRRIPRITRHAEHGGMDCPAFVHNRVPDIQICNTQRCPSEFSLFQLAYIA